MSTSAPDDASLVLADLRSGHQWTQAFRIAAAAEDGERQEGWDDASLISIYKECLIRGLTFQAAPVEFLDTCKRLSRLLFRYGRAREANNYLLQLRDLSPDPSSIPDWAWAYSAKLAYLEDLDYCIRRPDEILDSIEKAVAVNPSSSQASAVLADFINTAAQRLSEIADPDAATRLSVSILGFLEKETVPEPERIQRALSKLEPLLGAQAQAVSPKPDTEAPAETAGLLWQREIQALRSQLEKANSDAKALASEKEALERRNEQLLLELHLLREETEQDASAFEKLAGLIDRLDANLQQLRTDWQSSQTASPAQSEATTQGRGRITPATLPARSRIIVVGQSRASEIHLLGICKDLGLEKGQIDFRLSYEAFDTLDITSLQYNDSVAGILIGPVPHKVPGQHDPVQALMHGEGFPPTVRIETSSGELKITKSSFREALENLLTRIASLEPSIH